MMILVLIIKLEPPGHHESYGNVPYHREYGAEGNSQGEQSSLPPSPAASLLDHLASSSCGPLLNFLQKVTSQRRMLNV